jgi:hypothetical protein
VQIDELEMELEGDLDALGRLVRDPPEDLQAGAAPLARIRYCLRPGAGGGSAEAETGFGDRMPQGSKRAEAALFFGGLFTFQPETVRCGRIMLKLPLYRDVFRDNCSTPGGSSTVDVVHLVLIRAQTFQRNLSTTAMALANVCDAAALH